MGIYQNNAIFGGGGDKPGNAFVIEDSRSPKRTKHAENDKYWKCKSQVTSLRTATRGYPGQTHRSCPLEVPHCAFSFSQVSEDNFLKTPPLYWSPLEKFREKFFAEKRANHITSFGTVGSLWFFFTRFHRFPDCLVVARVMWFTLPSSFCLIPHPPSSPAFGRFECANALLLSSRYRAQRLPT